MQGTCLDSGVRGVIECPHAPPPPWRRACVEPVSEAHLGDTSPEDS